MQDQCLRLIVFRYNAYKPKQQNKVFYPNNHIIASVGYLYPLLEGRDISVIW